MPNTTPTPPTRASARLASMKVDHRIAKTRSRRARRNEPAPDAATKVRREIVETPPPETTPAAYLSAEIAWMKCGIKPTIRMLVKMRKRQLRATQKGTASISQTSFFFQHPDKNVANGITGLAESAIVQYGEELTFFPEPFNATLDSVDDASEWNIGFVTSHGGGIQPRRTKDAMPKVDTVVIDVNLDSSSTVVVPYDPVRYGNLYSASMPGQLINAARAP